MLRLKLRVNLSLYMDFYCYLNFMVNHILDFVVGINFLSYFLIVIPLINLCLYHNGEPISYNII